MPKALPNPFSLENITEHPLYEKVKELVNPDLPRKERNIAIRHSIATIMGIGINAAQAAEAAENIWPRISKGEWKSSIGDDFIRCLICGEEMPALTEAHLKRHGASIKEYKHHFGIPIQVRLACASPREFPENECLPNPFKMKVLSNHPFFGQAMEMARERQKIMPMTPEETADFLKKTIARLMGLPVSDVRDRMNWPAPKTEDDWYGSICDDYIECMICGEKMRLLTNAHLRKHGGDKTEYRKHFHIPSDVPLACNSLLEEKRQAMAKNKIWRYRNGGKSQKKKTQANQDMPQWGFDQLFGFDEL